MNRHLLKMKNPFNAKAFLIIFFSLAFVSHSLKAQEDPCPFLEQNGFVVMEAESAQYGGTYWTKGTTVPDHTGEGYLQYSGGASMGVTGNSVVTYSFTINNPGRYSFKVRGYREHAEDNDIWVKFPVGTPITMIEEEHTGDLGNDWFKFLIGARNQWHWFMKTQYFGVAEGHENLHDVYLQVDQPGTYTVQIAGRSVGFKMDRIVLYNRTMGVSGNHAMDLTRAESGRDNCTPAASTHPYLANDLQNQEVMANETLTYTFADNTFEHPEGLPLTYEARGKGYHPLPAWLSFNATTRTFSGTPAFEDGGRHDIIVIARQVGDNSKFAVGEFSITVTGNNPPVANMDIDQQFATADETFTYTFAENVFSDQDGHTLTYSASLEDNQPLPVWLTFNDASRTFSGTPSTTDIGTYDIVITANDGHGGTATAGYQLHVVADPGIASVTKANKNNCMGASVYPNPVESGFNIDLGNAKGDVSYSLIDNMGKTYNLNVFGTSADISSMNLKPGLYYLRINSETENCNAVVNIIKK